MVTKLCHTFLTHLLILHRGHLLLEDPEPCLLLFLREPTHGKQTAFAERLHHCILIRNGTIPFPFLQSLKPRSLHGQNPKIKELPRVGTA